MEKPSLPKIRLSPFSRATLNTCIEAVSGGANAVKERCINWKDEVADALILAGMSGFAAYGATAVTGVPNLEAAIIAAGSMFFGTLAAKRGLVKQQ
jgi:hypothetical protein